MVAKSSGIATRCFAGDLLYILSGLDTHKDLLPELGNPKHGKFCLYLKTLDGVDSSTLRQLVRASLKERARRYPE